MIFYNILCNIDIHNQFFNKMCIIHYKCVKNIKYNNII